MKEPHKTTKKLLNNIKQERIEKIKRATEPIDAIPILRFLTENRERFTKEERNKILDALEEGFEKAGLLLIERAIMEGDITEKEYKKYLSIGLTIVELSPLLQAYYHRKECKKCKEKPVLVTTKKTGLYKHREKLQKKFGVKINTPDEAINIMKKGMSKKTLKEIEKLEKELIKKLKQKKRDNETRKQPTNL